MNDDDVKKARSPGIWVGMIMMEGRIESGKEQRMQHDVIKHIVT